MARAGRDDTAGVGGGTSKQDIAAIAAVLRYARKTIRLSSLANRRVARSSALSPVLA